MKIIDTLKMYIITNKEKQQERQRNIVQTNKNSQIPIKEADTTNITDEKHDSTLSEINTLYDLTKTGKTYWKFSQSSKDMRSSDEVVFLEYKENSIVHAEDKEKGLSFVPAEFIGKCCSYGDQITEIIVDVSNPLFQKIKDEPVITYDNSLGELESRKLYVGKSYSLKDPTTINKIIQLSNCKAVQCFLNGVMESQENKLQRLGFLESAEYIKFIKSTHSYLYEKDIREIKEQINEIYNDFIKQKENQQMATLMDQLYDNSNVTKQAHVSEIEIGESR